MPTLKTLRLLATRPHKYGTRHLTAGEEYDVPIRQAVALVAGRKARFADKPAKTVKAPVTVEEKAPAVAVVEEKASDIDALRTQAQGLGIDVDGRWGLARLQYEISKVRG